MLKLCLSNHDTTTEGSADRVKFGIQEDPKSTLYMREKQSV